MKMKALILTVGSFLLTAGVISNAYLQKRQFYPSVVFITKSSPSMAILYVQAFVFVILMWKLMRKVFFGQLRAAEMEHLIERSWYAVTETCLAFTVFRDDFSPRFVALFTLLLFLKCFHWLGEDRVDYMERSPVISFLFHMRVLSLLAVLGLLDVYFINHAYYSTLIKGASVQLVFGFEYAILVTVVIHILVKYVLHSVDLQSENPWDNKAVYLLYTELILGFIKVVIYMLFLAIMIKVHTFPLFAIRPMYLTMRTFKKAFNDVIMSRRAIRNMNTLYPDATAEELAAGDNVCIICREEMADGCKRLPCNHIFHASCLRSWFQRQQTCPTCRMDVLRATPTPTVAAPAQPPAAAPAQPPVPGVQQLPANMFGGFPMFPGAVPPAAPPAAAASTAPTTLTGQATSAAAAASSAAAAASSGMPPFMMPPPFFMPMPFMTPPPLPPGNLQGLSEQELLNLEGSERQQLEARIQWLRNIHTLLDTAVVQLSQYAAVVSASPMQRQMPGGASTITVTATATTPTPAETPSTERETSRQSTNQPTSQSSSQPPKESGIQAENNMPMASSSKTDELGEESKTEELEGAVGGVIDEVTDNSELSELRKRRIQRFSSGPLEEDLDLD